MIVDDEQDIRESLLDYFHVMLPEVDVLVARDAAEALQIAGSKDLDLVVSDYRMPGMDGIRLLAELHKGAPHLPCILITAFPEAEIRRRAREDADVAAFFAKPVDVDALLMTVRSHLET